MKDYIKKDPWKIREESFDPSVSLVSESLFSLGNGRMGQRGNFEETYSGKTLQGNYIAGVYYPDKTRVGWWKNGYPEYFAKVINAANWMGLKIFIGGHELDLATVEVLDFSRELNMEEGYLQRNFTVAFADGKKIKVRSIRLNSIVDDEAATYQYSITALNFSDSVLFESFIDGDVKNQDANYEEKFWDEVHAQAIGTNLYLTLRTQKTLFDVCTGTAVRVIVDGNVVPIDPTEIRKEKLIGNVFAIPISEGQTIILEKIAVNLSSENHSKELLLEDAMLVLDRVSAKGFEILKSEQAQAWKEKWGNSDIAIDGDVSAQQAIRFNIFQLYQTYTGEDARLNIGPKGFTGEKYGGVTYWDTEAYCLPFYLSTADASVARNLLIYRYQHLPKAIENAEKLGFKNGAALYPMVTMNGEECHNEWEITFEEIHRNAAIAFAIYKYIRYTDDHAYLAEYGLEVLIGIARFWSQRVNWSIDKGEYVMLGVTGPNEYENNVNNNWYTSRMAVWCLQYTIEALGYVADNAPVAYETIIAKAHFDTGKETAAWKDIIAKMYLPEDRVRGIFLQQDGYLDKEQILAKDLPVEERPLNQHWSWDRILRSCFIKQADVLQGFYFLEDDFDVETLRRNFDFYEPRTVHESSLSPCVHSILAAKLGDIDRAYEFYLRTARLDLDDYNNDTEDGLHITSMAGTWMSVVEGFAGMRVKDGILHFAPLLPKEWNGFSFKIKFRGALLRIAVSQEQLEISNIEGAQVRVEAVGVIKELQAAGKAIWGLYENIVG